MGCWLPDGVCPIQPHFLHRICWETGSCRAFRHSSSLLINFILLIPYPSLASSCFCSFRHSYSTDSQELYASAASTASSTRSSTSSGPSLVFFYPCTPSSLPRTFPYSTSLLVSCISSLIRPFLVVSLYISQYLSAGICKDTLELMPHYVCVLIPITLRKSCQFLPFLSVAVFDFSSTAISYYCLSESFILNASII